MNINAIVNETKKYHYIMSSNSKTIIIGSSNSKNDAKTIALKKLGSNINNFIGKNIYLVKIKKVSKKILSDNAKSKIKLSGGLIFANIEQATIISDKRIQNLGGTQRIFFSEKYLEKNKGIDMKDIKKIINDIHNKKLNITILDIKIL